MMGEEEPPFDKDYQDDSELCDRLKKLIDQYTHVWEQRYAGALHPQRDRRLLTW